MTNSYQPPPPGVTGQQNALNRLRAAMDRHAQRERNEYAARRAAGLCTDCGEVETQNAICDDCKVWRKAKRLAHDERMPIAGAETVCVYVKGIGVAP